MSKFTVKGMMKYLKRIFLGMGKKQRKKRNKNWKWEKYSVNHSILSL